MLDSYITLPENVIPDFNSTKRQLIQDHKILLINHSKTKIHTVDYRYSYPEEFSLYAYLKLAGIDYNLYYPIMVMNNLNSTMEFNSSIKELLVPDAEIVMMIENSIVDF